MRLLSLLNVIKARFLPPYSSSQHSQSFCIIQKIRALTFMILFSPSQDMALFRHVRIVPPPSAKHTGHHNRRPSSYMWSTELLKKKKQSNEWCFSLPLLKLHFDCLLSQKIVPYFGCCVKSHPSIQKRVRDCDMKSTRSTIQTNVLSTETRQNEVHVQRRSQDTGI